MTEVERLLFVEEITIHLGVSKETIYRWSEKDGNRQLPAIRIGRLWKFKASEVDEWIRIGGAVESSDKGAS